MLLKDKNAVIYGGGGSIGGAVARAFAREGARVFLAGRTQATLDAVADDDPRRVAADVARSTRSTRGRRRARRRGRAAGIDISFNLISHGDVQGTPMAEMDVEDYLRPVVTAVRTTFLTARAAARHMTSRRAA